LRAWRSTLIQKPDFADVSGRRENDVDVIDHWKVCKVNVTDEAAIEIDVDIEETRWARSSSLINPS
jgi:hypothetical protein